jgi:HNH endonuclease
MSGRYRYRPRIPAEVRFWRRVDVGDPTACWPWVGAKDRDGYGLFLIKATDEPDGQRICMHAQRFAWTLAKGPIPAGLDVLHHCDNPPCCNDAHLFLGTNLDNVADRDRKGRTAKGERHWWYTKPECRRPVQPPPPMYGEANPSAKLTIGAVRAIRLDQRIHRIIAAEHDVSKSLIGAIQRREVWGA